MSKNKIKAWLKEHKMELLVGVGTTALVVFLAWLGIKQRKAGKPVLGIVHEIEDIDIKLDTATVTEAWKELGGVNMILNDIKVSDLGELGKDMIKNIPNVTEDTDVSCILGLLGTAE